MRTARSRPAELASPRNGRRSGRVLVLLVLAILAALLGFVVLFGWSSFGLRWVAGSLLLFCGALGLGLLRVASLSLEQVFLGLFALFSSIRVDVHLYRSGDVHGFPFSLVDVAWIVLMVSWIARQRRSPDRIEIPRAITLAFLILALTGVVAGLRASFLPSGLRAIVTTVQGYFLFLYVWNLRLTERGCIVLGRWFCAAILLQALIGCAQAVTQSNLGLGFLGATEAAFSSDDGLSRVGGTLGWSNRFALFVNTLILVPVAMAVTARSWRARIAFGAVFALTVTALVLTKSRGGWLSFGLVFLPFLYLSMKERWGAFHRSFFVSWAGAAALVAVFAIPATRERLLADDKGSAAGRIPMALTAMAMMAEHPDGVGIENYMDFMHLYDASEDGQALRFRHPVHNSYLLLGAEQGILALLAFVAILWLCFRHLPPLLRSGGPGFPRLFALALMGGALTSAIYWLLIAEQSTGKLYTWFLLGLAVAASRFALRSGQQGLPASERSPGS